MKPETPAEKPGLVRALGPLMATAVVVGTVIGSGVFKKPQAVADAVPYSGLVALVWVLGGLLALLGALSLAEVSVLYPKAGGNYVFLREGYGRPFGFLWGWVEFWIIRTASIAALANIFTENFHTVLQQAVGSTVPVLDFWTLQGVTVTVIAGLAFVNVLGVRWGGGVQLLVTLVKVGSLLAVLLLPFVVLALTRSGEPAPLRTANLSPAWASLDPPPADTLDGAGAVAGTPAAAATAAQTPGEIGFGLLVRFATALVAVLWAYHGWMNAAPIAEEVSRPQRNLPLAFLVGVGTVIFLYLGANLAYSLVFPQQDLAAMRDRTVAVNFAERLVGPVGLALAAGAVMVSVFGALNGNLLVGPRLLYAMGEDGLAPRALGAVHPRFRTPALAIVVMAGWSCLLVVGAAAVNRLLQGYQVPVLGAGSFTLDLNVLKTKPLFDLLTDFAIFGSVTFETLAVATIFVFRWRRPDAERPYRCLGYPVVPALYVCIMASVAAKMILNPADRPVSLTGVAFVAVGAVVYFLFLRSPSKTLTTKAQRAQSSHKEEKNNGSQEGAGPG
jgi:amino acid transporter